MSSKNQHVIPHNGKWAVKPAGAKSVSSTHRTQEAAIKAARANAMREQSEMLIHGRNGQIRERNTYGKDPYPPRG